jgi:hypothetical protein
MGFVIRALFVVGVLYLISPLRAPLPDWLAKPSAGPVQVAVRAGAATSVQPTPVATSVEALGNVALAACKGREKTCLDAAASALKIATQKTVEPKSTDTGDLIAALLKDNALPERPQALAVADSVLDGTNIPLPPRRDQVPPSATPSQKKI